MARLKTVLRATLPAALIAFLLSGALSCGTGNRMHGQKAYGLPLRDSLVVDRDGNSYPFKKMLDNKLWIMVNLKLNIPDSYCYESSKDNCEQYGRLYTWEAAKKGCSLLGEGWRLPTNADWLKLSELYGGFTADSNASRKEAYKALLYTGGSGFNAVLGGGRNPDLTYSRLDAHGFYWTATKNDSATAWFSNFAKGSQAFYLQKEGEKPRALSVRCLGDINAMR